MSDIAIRCENLGKRYRRGSRAPYHRFTELLAGMATAPYRMARRALTPKTNDAADEDDGWFWALKDINLEVKRGEVLGIIGRNGAGKSTLLKLLSRITEPTTGHADIYGRVGSLLEVGTGFHPELTGRENIYLNGAILGMTRNEIRNRFDEIVSFSGIEQFLDTPVKRYSSGMQTRLGFAVAAHLDPEILIVDEVLAVGDIHFQKKCMQKMSTVASGGTTVLLVSHQLDIVRRIATRALLLSSGQAVASGDPTTVIEEYLQTSADTLNSDDFSDRRQVEVRDAQIIAFDISTASGESKSPYAIGESILFAIDIELQKEIPGAHLTIEISSPMGTVIHKMTSLDCDVQFPTNPGRYQIEALIDSIQLCPGTYHIRVGICDRIHELHDFVNPIATFDIIHDKYPDIGRSLAINAGLVFASSDWRISER